MKKTCEPSYIRGKRVVSWVVKVMPAIGWLEAWLKGQGNGVLRMFGEWLFGCD